MKPILQYCLLLILGLSINLAAADDAKAPVVIGLSAGFGLKHSRTAQAIEKGILLAIDEINAAGGVLDGRPLKLVSRDDRGLPTRGKDILTEFADDENVLAVFNGRFSPVAIALAPIANARQILFLSPWSAADSITQHAYPNYVFRVSLTDSWAMQVILDSAHQRSYKKIALFIPNTAWGRSCEQALRTYQKRERQFPYLTIKYNLGETDFRRKIKLTQDFGADAIVLVANESEAAPVVQQLAELPIENRLPVIAHWGVLGGDFSKLAGEALHAVDFTLISTFSFERNHRQKTQKVIAGVQRLFKQDAREMLAQPGFAHAYDLTHMLALAIEQARTTKRDKVRAALERLEIYHGLVRSYQQPFNKLDHEGLDKQQVFLGRYDSFGKLQVLGGK